jgi:threonine dehydrogenase-like Zn-dependent dehydrogenase
VVCTLGQLIIMACPATEVQFDIRWVFMRQIRMRSAISCDPLSWEIALNLLNRELVDLKALVTDVFPLDDWQQASAGAKKHEGTKIHLTP